jgi:uncharacterized protein YuzE
MSKGRRIFIMIGQPVVIEASRFPVSMTTHLHDGERRSSQPDTRIEIAMRLTYDPRRNMAYIRLRPHSAEVETIRVSDEINVDLAPDGTVAGIELLNANEQLRASDGGQLVVADEAPGSEVTVALPAA